MKKIMLLGSGELGKELVIAAKRAGLYVVACDRYDNAPAMQVADEREIFSMLDGDALAAAVARHNPDIIVPEIEAIRTERLFDFEAQGIQVVPSAKAVNYTMNRRAIRDLASRELGLRTAKYFYAKTFEEFKSAADAIGFPCVVKPLMSSSGHGQSYVHNDDELQQAFTEAMEGSRGDVREVIIEEFIDFDSEFTLLTVTQKNGKTLFCPPIGHVQKGGDYRESWQPYQIAPQALEQAQHMAAGRDVVGPVDSAYLEGDILHLLGHGEVAPRVGYLAQADYLSYHLTFSYKGRCPARSWPHAWLSRADSRCRRPTLHSRGRHPYGGLRGLRACRRYADGCGLPP